MTDFFDREGDRAYTRVYKAETPDILKAWAEFDGAVFASEGREIPLKYRELIALAVGITTQCPSMQYVHWVVMPTASAMSSRYFSGISRPSAANTAPSNSAQAFRMSGVSAL